MYIFTLAKLSLLCTNGTAYVSATTNQSMGDGRSHVLCSGEDCCQSALYLEHSATGSGQTYS